MKSLVLGSGSPRRLELLKEMGFEPSVRPSLVEEVIPKNVSVLNAAEYLAKLKNENLLINENEILLTADTVVLHEDEILGKPVDQAEAIEMLSKLSNKSHLVISGVCIRDGRQKISFSNTTEVKFRNLTLDEIEYYVDKYAPFDKAGAYGIQEWIGKTAVEYIKGSYFNVVGLPCDQVYKQLTDEFGLSVSK